MLRPTWNLTYAIRTSQARGPCSRTALSPRVRCWKDMGTGRWNPGRSRAVSSRGREGLSAFRRNDAFAEVQLQGSMRGAWVAPWNLYRRQSYKRAWAPELYVPGSGSWGNRVWRPFEFPAPVFLKFGARLRILCNEKLPRGWTTGHCSGSNPNPSPDLGQGKAVGGRTGEGEGAVLHPPSGLSVGWKILLTARALRPNSVGWKILSQARGFLSFRKS